LAMPQTYRFSKKTGETSSLSVLQKDNENLRKSHKIATNAYICVCVCRGDRPETERPLLADGTRAGVVCVCGERQRERGGGSGGVEEEEAEEWRRRGGEEERRRKAFEVSLS
jgi:hypothetical protein